MSRVNWIGKINNQVIHSSLIGAGSFRIRARATPLSLVPARHRTYQDPRGRPPLVWVLPDQIRGKQRGHPPRRAAGNHHPGDPGPALCCIPMSRFFKKKSHCHPFLEVRSKQVLCYIEIGISVVGFKARASIPVRTPIIFLTDFPDTTPYQNAAFTLMEDPP